MITFYCECCGKNQPVDIEPLSTDELDGDLIWGDVVCVACKFVIASISADVPGTYEFVLTGRESSDVATLKRGEGNAYGCVSV